MAGLVTGDGTGGYADGTPKLWNGTSYVNPESIHIWDGGKYVKLWPSSPQYYDSRLLEGSSTTNTSIRTTGSSGCVVVVASGNVTEYARVNGVDMTLVQRDNELAMYYMTGLPEASHAIEVSRSGSGNYIVGVASYSGVTTVSGGKWAFGIDHSPTISPNGSGSLMFAGFAPSNVSDISHVSPVNGTVREAYRRASGNNLVMADSPTAPVTLATVDSGIWYAVAIWLS